jgi:carbohydrate diacid regulator
VAYLGKTKFLILKDMGSRPKDYEADFQNTLSSLYFSLSNEIRSIITIGVGEFRKNEAGLKESCQEAEAALLLGKQLWGEGKLYHYDSFGVVAPLLSGITEQNINLPKDLIKRLNENPRLMETLETYFSNDISLTKTAKRLGLHRNTLVYRLEKISELTGYDPRIFNEAFQLKMALIMESYSAV